MKTKCEYCSRTFAKIEEAVEHLNKDERGHNAIYIDNSDPSLYVISWA